ncbi:serine hydrolase [Methylorubrum salsuginis]|uniref:CubicO group peptidase, beta-lactamase class C family n=1 Tax=Methylorubrum salsuginis TaxID=414703 RepID=A0A1I4EC58_9HYPH|nr:serine hydrolase [Methylorubrum salsuginis]SFL02853.1 CubicO group peptidase, beta-lactamase class C family [Methylorubrum salsuginis]
MHAGPLVSVLVFAILLAPARAAPADDAKDYAKDYAKRAAALIEPYRESGLMSGTILVAKDGKPVFRQAYGLANREWNAKNTLDTHFRIGSLTKQFTAAAILQLVEAGKLSLDDPVSRFYPEAPKAWEAVRVRHLLNHTSGIINYTALPDYLPAISRIERPARALVELVSGEALLFPPGERVEYSNTNYLLLGLAIEFASGQPYARYLAEHVFSPLGLKDTGYDDATALLPRRAAGYRFGQGQWRNAAPMASSVAYAAGGLYSTVDDLLAWDEALFSGKVISEASRQKMFDDGGRGYGFGWYVGTAHGRTLWSHGGAVSGFLAMTDYYPGERLAVIVLANNENAPAQKMARELGALWFGLIETPDPIVLEDMILDRYAGTYRLGPRFFLEVRRDGGRLMVQGTGQPANAFLPESDRTFFSRVADARITIDTEPDGRPNGLVLHQNGRDRIAPRLDPAEAARILAEPRRPPVEVPLDPARLSPHVGRYSLAPGLVLTVGLENGRLWAQATGEPRHALFAEDERSFFMKSLDAQVTFEGDGAGRTTGLVLHRGGLDTPCPRIPDSRPPSGREAGRGRSEAGRSAPSPGVARRGDRE